MDNLTGYLVSRSYLLQHFASVLSTEVPHQVPQTITPRNSWLQAEIRHTLARVRAR